MNVTTISTLCSAGLAAAALSVCVGSAAGQGAGPAAAQSPEQAGGKAAQRSAARPSEPGKNGPAVPGIEEAASASALRSAYAKFRDRIEQSPFGQPIHLESVQSADSIRGDIVARVDRRFPTVRGALGDAHRWCDILILHPNIQQCRASDRNASADARKPVLLVQVGRAAHPVEFTYELAASDADFLDVRLFAKAGPLGTRDYRIHLRATPLNERQTLMHLAFSHDYGVRARLAMQAYLATFGQGKVGFTVVERGADDRPVYVGDFRGALERNAMRYYLAIDAYLESLSAPADQQAEKRIRTWYAYTERYPVQLREEPEYLELKRRAIRDQGTAAASANPSGPREVEPARRS